MSYVDSSLMKDEKVIFRTRLSLAAVFVPPVALAIVGAIFSEGARDLLIGVAVVAAIMRGINYATSEFAVTDKRVIIKVGVLRHRTLEMQLSKVETVAVNQGVIGRAFGYGEIVVTGTGGTKERFKSVSQPLELRRAVQTVAA
jgi:uncharacterized membrane protein YdbT with pleckstrin-like domain